MDERERISPLGAILAVLGSILLLLFVGALFFVFLGTAAGAVLSELLIPVVPLAYMLSRKVNVRNYVGLEVKPKYILLGMALGVLILFSEVAVTTVLTAILGLSEAVEEANRTILDMSSSPIGLLAAIASLALAGICEEFTFRGFLQNAITRRYSLLPALLVSSFAWSVLHYDPRFIYTTSVFIVGLMLGYIYNHWRSYVVPAVAHATYNLIVIAILLAAL